MTQHDHSTSSKLARTERCSGEQGVEEEKGSKEHGTRKLESERKRILMTDAEVDAVATSMSSIEAQQSSPLPAALAQKSGYYYAHKQASATPKTLVGAQTIYNHTPLDEEQKQKIQRENSASNGESAWNTAGTWEEKDFSKWAKGRVGELLCEISTESGITFSKTSSVDECHASIVLSRGRKKAIIDIEKIVVNWKKDGGAKGTVTLNEVSCTALDEMEMKVKLEKAGSEDARALEAELMGLRDKICAAVTCLLEELTAK